MNKVILTNTIVSKGFENNPAVKLSDKSDAAFFTIGVRVYDPKEETNHRFINFDVKAFAEMGTRIRKMDVKEGSRLDIVGRLDQESWDDTETKKRRTKTIIILDDVEYGYSPNKNGQNGNGNGGNGGQNGNGQNGNGNGNASGQGGYGNPGMGAMPQQYGQMPQQAMPQQQMPQQPMTQNYPQQQPMPQQGQMPQGFTGYENFDANGNDVNPYFGQG